MSFFFTTRIHYKIEKAFIHHHSSAQTIPFSHEKKGKSSQVYNPMLAHSKETATSCITSFHQSQPNLFPYAKKRQNTQYPNTPSHHVCIPRSGKSRTSTSTPPLNHTQSHNPVLEKSQQGRTPAQQSLHSKTTPNIPPSLAQFNSSQLQFK